MEKNELRKVEYEIEGESGELMDRTTHKGLFHVWQKELAENGNEIIWALIENEDGKIVHIESVYVKFLD